MFTHTTQSGALTLSESFHGYQLTHNATGKTVEIGDGSQFVADDDDDLTDEEAKTLQTDRMVDDLEDSESEYLEAYFKNL